MNENSIYIVTPPDMQLAQSGPSITALSTDSKFVSEVERTNENLFKTVSITIYHPGEEIVSDHLAWLISVMRLSDTVFVDLDSITERELLVAVLSGASLIYFSKNKSNTDLIGIVNTVINEATTIYNSPQDYYEMIVAEIVSM